MVFQMYHSLYRSVRTLAQRADLRQCHFPVQGSYRQFHFDLRCIHKEHFPTFTNWRQCSQTLSREIIGCCPAVFQVRFKSASKVASEPVQGIHEKLPALQSKKRVQRKRRMLGEEDEVCMPGVSII